MTLKSMTGFARHDGAAHGMRWHWEVRSVNGRGLDVRLRLPPGFDGMEPGVREAVAQSVVRGSVSVNLAVEREAGATELRVNEAVLAQVLAVVERLRATGSFDAPRPEGILGLRGVLEFSEPSESEATIAARQAAMLVSLNAALEGLGQARAVEGARLGHVLLAHMDQIDRIIDFVARSPSRTPEAIRLRISEQLQRIAGTTGALDEHRLYQEAALIATKADVEEEVKRLSAHTAQARELIAAHEPVGRKLDFLAQEFNREANTLCSKANDVEITRQGLDLKAIIDQMREQVQNIE
ncbi:MAG: YicC/YloC family endoribonuclease [Hyphomicrobiaceae bacterium]